MLLQLICHLISVCLVHLPPSLIFLFVLVPSLAISLSSTKWPLPASSWQYIASMAKSRWTQTLKLPTQTATCSELVEMPLNPPAPVLMHVCSPNWSAGTAVQPCEWRHCAPFIRSLFAAVGRFSTFIRYQVM